MTETELRSLIRTSPDKGYRQLFEQYHRYAFAIVCRTLAGCGSSRDAEDCIVDVFADVIMNYDTASEGSLKAYIGVCARNKALNIRRAYNNDFVRNAGEDELAGIADKSSGVAESAESSQIMAVVLDKIEALGEPDSTIIIHKYLFGRDSPDIARTLGMNPGAVRMRMSRARKKLKKELEELGIEL